MRKLKPFHDFDRLTPDQLDRIHANLAESSYEKTCILLRDEFQILITYGRLRRYYNRYLETQQIKERVGVNLTVGDYIKVQNGEAIPFGAVTHHLIQIAACQEAAADDHTITELLSLQRIANADFQQKLAREKLALEHRRQALREQERALKHLAKSAPSTLSTASTASTPESQEPDQKPFRMWTAEELRINQPKIEAAFQAHPVLRHIGLPPVEVPPTPPPDPFDEHDLEGRAPRDLPSARPTASLSNEPTPATPAPNPCSSVKSVVQPPPNPAPAAPMCDNPPVPPSRSNTTQLDPSSCSSRPSWSVPPNPAATELDQLLAEARANPEAPFDPRLLKYVAPHASTAHLSRDLSLPLAHRVTCYAYARQVEEDRGKNSDLVGLWAARNFTSKLCWCPCGQDLPCPDHPPMSEEFFESQSIFADYLAGCGLPSHDLGDLIHRLKKQEEQQNP